MTSKITLIYPFRDRDTLRIQKSLDSLSQQQNLHFKVIFVDYGSDDIISEEVVLLLSNYSFVEYLKSYTKNQPWNKSRAINIALKYVDTDFVFISDVDMFYKDNFITTLYTLLDHNTTTYFKIGYLNETESLKNIPFQEYLVEKYSNEEATGLTLFPTQVLKAIGGFDEFFHFWGSEDTDAHVRIQNSGCNLRYFDQDILMLHQYHDSFHKKQKDIRFANITPRGIVALNYQHQRFHQQYKITTVNSKKEGGLVSNQEIKNLQNAIQQTYTISNQQSLVDYYLNEVLPHLPMGVYEFRFCIDAQLKESKMKKWLKKRFNKKSIPIYSLSAINELIIYQIIHHYRFHVYTYQVLLNTNTLILTIQIP